MKALPETASTETKIPGVYVWEPPGKAISVRLSLDVVDRMLQDIMRGFGAVPKRGAEVGGVLLGHSTTGDKTVVSIDDYALVPIEYKRSPSYLFSDEDARAFTDAVKAARNGSHPLLNPVGYFRSHTREGVGLGPEDLELLNTHFPDPHVVALIVKPYATKVGQAGFYFREDGSFQSGGPLLEFPFRRRELDPTAAPQGVPGRGSERRLFRSRVPAPDQAATRPRPGPEPAPVLPEPRPDGRSESRTDGRPARTAEPLSIAPAHPIEPLRPSESPLSRTDDIAASYALELKSRKRNVWVWAPLSFIFLLLGVLLGFQAALSMRPPLPPGSNDPYNLNLSVTRNGNNLQVKWDRQSLAVRTAQRGLLTIEDGKFSKPVPLSPADLQSGSVVYPPSTDRVTLRLDVMVSGRDTVSETLEWRQ